MTARLFAEFPDAAALARAPVGRLEALIRSVGFFRRKARALIEAARAVVERSEGRLPETIEELTALAGVGRKTANVVLGHVFAKPAIAVDTHVGRLARRLGLTSSSDPERIEHELEALLPPKKWTDFSMRLILHGRRVCRARNPRCSQCMLASECPRVGLAGNRPPAERVS